MNALQLDHGWHRAQAAKAPLRLLAQDIAVPMNVGSLFRIADALGVERIHLTGSTPVPPNSKIRKTARATEKAVPFDYSQDARDVVAACRAEGYLVVALELTRNSIDLRRFTPARGQRICLVLGAEDAGVSEAVLEMCDLCLHIPMRGQNSSMNVATACAIAAFHLTSGQMP